MPASPPAESNNSTKKKKKKNKNRNRLMGQVAYKCTKVDENLWPVIHIFIRGIPSRATSEWDCFSGALAGGVVINHF